MTWLAGFLTTVTVAFVLCEMSASDELRTLAELSLRAEVLVWLISVTDEVSVIVSIDDGLSSGDVPGAQFSF